jgi:predicted metal-dependent hydrolase
MSFWPDWLGFSKPPAQAPSPKAKRGKAVSGVALGEQSRLSAGGIAYTLTRGKRRSIGLVVTSGGLVIRAPSWTPIYEIDQAIDARRDWILRSLDKQKQRLADMAELSDGGHVLFHGKRIPVELRQGLFDAVELNEQHCIVTTRDGVPNPKLLDTEIKRLAQAELPMVAMQLAAEASLPLKAVTLSKARTMWGSCTADGRVRLNFRLIQLKPALMRHVVAHELAHLVEFNHSQRFWAIVKTLDPNMGAHRRAIKSFAVLLEL